MNAALLLEHYARIADAPDSIVQLRRFVLDLAVRGKLVEQDTNVEPAAELLKRIAAEKAKLRLKAPANRQVTDQPPFQLPAGWYWTTVGEICSKTGSGSTPRGGKEVYKSSGIPFLRSQNVYDDGLRLADVAFIDAGTHQRMGSTKVVARDLLLNITGGSMGRCCRVPDDFDEANVSQHVAILRLAVCGTEGFLHLLVRSPYFQAFIFEEQTGAGRGGLPKNRMDNIAVALPPLAEQHRIVAKVNELMALCDQLEAARAEREAARDAFTLSTLVKLNTPNAETFSQDARFALANITPLTTRPDQVKQLRQTILNLAVRGKLVEQDAADEPALALLKRLMDERAHLAKAGGIPRPKEAKRDPDFLTEPLPVSWLSIALGDVCNLVTSGSRGWGEFYAETGPGFIRAQNIRFGKLRLEGLACVNPPKKSEGARTQVAKGDLLVVITGAGVTNPALLDVDLGEAYVSQHVGLVRPCSAELSRWLLVCLMADAGGRAELTMRAYGAGKPGLNLDNIRSLSIPLPPLAEQYRIVAKVDELMELCDRLEASLTTGEQTRSRLLEVVLYKALEPA